MQANLVNGWREVLARIFNGFTVEYGVTPEWLVNPDTGRRLKLDYLFPDVGVAVRFVGLQGDTRRRRKSDEEVAAEEDREATRAAVCRAHGVTLISIDPDGELREALRSLELGLAQAAAQLARRAMPSAQKQKLTPLLGQARRQAGELTVRLTSPESLLSYAELWWDRQARLAAPAPAQAPTGPIRRYRVGMAVHHQKFGPGRVTAVEPAGADVQVTVDFVEAGVRTFAASLVGDKLTPR
jgi:hypothetical protein